jgi:hypothetical protein
MSRDLPVEFIGELTKKVVYPFFAVEIDFASGPLYLWTGYGDLIANGNTYLGAGQLVNISSIEETTEMEAKGATITMSGIPSSFLALALTEPYQGRPCRIYFGLWLSGREITTESDQVVTTENLFNFEVEGESNFFAEIFSGELDQMNISEQASTAMVSVTAENVLIKLERPVVRRFTNEDQKSRFPADKGLEFVAGLQDKEIFWGKTTQKGFVATAAAQIVNPQR